MPCFTQAFTRQPVAESWSGDAERTSPLSRAARRERKAAIASGSPTAAGPAAKCRSMVDCSWEMDWLALIAFRVYQLRLVRLAKLFKLVKIAGGFRNSCGSNTRGGFRQR